MSIRSVTTAGQEGRMWRVGSWMPWEPKGTEPTRITPIEVNGQMASVPWFLVVYNDGRYVEVNGAFVEFVEHEPEEGWQVSDYGTKGTASSAKCGDFDATDGCTDHDRCIERLEADREAAEHSLTRYMAKAHALHLELECLKARNTLLEAELDWLVSQPDRNPDDPWYCSCYDRDTEECNDGAKCDYCQTPGRGIVSPEVKQQRIKAAHDAAEGS